MRARIRNDGSGPARIDIFDDIGAGGWFSEGYTPASFADAIKGVSGPLDVHINSGGGDVADGIAIASAIRAYPGPKRTVVDGMAASIASVIAQAGDERIVEPGAMLMIHDPLTACMGNQEDFLKVAETLGKHGDNLAQQYADRAGGTAAQWRDVMRQEAWYTADEAVAAGLADRVGTAEARLPQGVDVESLAARAPGRIMAALRSMPSVRAAADDDGGDDAPPCKTCKGTGRLRHPGTGKPGVKCPSCDGTGTYDPDGPDEPDEDEPDEGDNEGMQDRLRNAAGTPYEPQPYKRTSDENVQCPACQKFSDDDARYCGQCGTQLTGRTDVHEAPLAPAASGGPAAVRALVRDELRAAGVIRDSLPEDVKSKFLADLKDDTPVDIAAGMRRLSQWAASGSYPTGTTYDDLKWFYDQCAEELKSRDPDSEAGGNFPPEKSASDSLRTAILDCHALMTALATLREAAGSDEGGKDSTGTTISAADAVAQYRAALKGATA